MKLACNCGHVITLSDSQVKTFADLQQPVTCPSCGIARKLPPGSAPKRKNRWPLILVGVGLATVMFITCGVAIVAAMMRQGPIVVAANKDGAVVVIPAPAAASEWPKLVHTFRGEGSQQLCETPPFDVKNEWEIHVEFRDPPTGMTIEPLGNKDRNYLVRMERNPQESSVFDFPKGGTYTVKFWSQRPWKVEVWQNKASID